MRKKLVITIAALLVLSIGLATIGGFVVFNQKEKGPFYVGVTYCGSSVEEAKELIDKVKNYTNLFILLSGPFQSDTTAMEEIGDYAVALNLNYAISSGAHIDDKSKEWLRNDWLSNMKEKWGEHFIGMYYNDEPAGNMLDGMVTLDYPYDVATSNTRKNPDGSIHINDNIYDENSGETYSVQTVYSPDGSILVNGQDRIKGHDGHVIYYPDGTITAYARLENNFYTSENLTECPLSISTYEQVLKRNPIKNNDEAANAFINRNKDFFEDINKKQLNKNQITVFTADYGLYWWDYQSGYDVVLAELAWNNTAVQEIALVRGSANLQNKQWGTCITWKYTHPPYLTDGEEMFEQLKMSYEAGANYVMVFNYSEDPACPNTLQDEHFLALERFWNDIVQCSDVVHGGIEAEAALVLPSNYGWGMRWQQDRIWGVWPADETSQEVWGQVQSKIDQYGLKLDVVFEKPGFFVSGQYSSIYYWNQQ